ncbi:VanZ family protein [Jeotgalibacillus terrae]|uniref:VanZ family protein n=1 Tax=Jeotgalibacillus terrae TaxID=587735 RepID=A0ABW5ZEA0_9BACL|nr:VanZ family protein [Jeotgalibacillus terrae]MBM7577927.1 VanZ family protein [Jeotgalibacillus terrae]
MIKWLKLLITALPLMYMILVWVLSSLPHNAVVDLPSGSFDRLLKESLHLIEFGILHFLFILALLIHGKLTVATHTLAAVFAAFYGFVDEIHQAFVPYRSATIIDAVKDIIGVVFVYLAIQRLYFVKRDSRLRKWFVKVERYFAG